MIEWIVSSSVLIAAVLLLRLALKGRVSPGLQYALWGIVLVRLLIPVSFFSSALSVQNLSREVLELPQVQELAQEEVSGVSVQEPVEESIPLGTLPEAHYSPVIEGGGERVPGTQEPSTGEISSVPDGAKEKHITVQEGLTLAWLAGMAVMAAAFVGCNAHFSRRLGRSRQPLEAPDSPVGVWVTDVVDTPCLFGLFRPAIYLPPCAAGDERTRGYVLAHEITHYQHFDYVWSVLRAVCLVLHWYNPLVWLAARVSRQDGELACDEGTLALLGEAHRGDYGRTLIGLTVKERFASALVTSTTMTGGRRAIRERIVILMKKPKTALFTLVAVVVVCGLVVGCTFTGAVTEPTETTLPSETLDPIEPSGHTPTPDMSEHSEQLPIPDQPGVDLSVTNRNVTDENPWFDDYRRLDGTGAGSNWYNAAMNHVYERAAELDLSMLFYSGLYGGSWKLLSEADAQALVDRGFDRNRDLQIISRAALEGVLADVFAVSLTLPEEALPEGWVYLESTDSYYTNHSDAVGVHSFAITNVEEMDNGLIHITYQPTDGAAVYDNGKWATDQQFVITLLTKAEPGGGCYVVANRRLEKHLAEPITRAEAPRASAEYEKYYDLLGDKPGGNWLNRAMSCIYADNREADIAQFTACDFIGKVGWDNLDAWDQMVLTGKGYDAQTAVHKITGNELHDAIWAAFKRDLGSYTYIGESVYDSSTYYFMKEPNAGVKDFTITEIQNLEDNQVRVYYVPGEGSTVTLVGEELERQELAITLRFANDGSCHAVSNLFASRNVTEGTALTEQQIEQVNEAFACIRTWEEDGVTHVSSTAISNFFTCYYRTPEGIDLREFLRYFGAYGVVNDFDSDITEEEFWVLKELKGEDFPFNGIEDYEEAVLRSAPIHKKPYDVVDAVLVHYTGVHLDALKDMEDPPVLYLEEYDAFYNFSSDFGPGIFNCTGGTIYDGYVELYSTEGNVLTLREENGRYYIQSHLPGISAP